MNTLEAYEIVDAGDISHDMWATAVATIDRFERGQRLHLVDLNLRAVERTFSRPRPSANHALQALSELKMSIEDLNKVDMEALPSSLSVYMLDLIMNVVRGYDDDISSGHFVDGTLDLVRTWLKEFRY